MRRLMCALAICAVAVPAWAGQVIDTPTLNSADNFRDLAGISAAYGGTGQADRAGLRALRPGMVYRSNVLTLSPADQAILVRLGIAEDIDLRTPYETRHQPDVLPPGVAYVNVNIFAVQKLPAPDMASAATADKQMQTYYQGFVTNPVERREIRIALLDVANADKPVVFHCSSGKDRTGWLAAILQNIAGVKQDVIMRDYLASNRYTEPHVAAILARVPAAERPAVAMMLSVKPQFLDAAYHEVQQNYGSMHGYITKGLGLTPTDIARLRAKLVAG